MIDREFWRGFFPLLLSFAAAQATQQVDAAMLTRLGDGTVAAYVVLTRIALPDTVLMIALGSVASVFVSQAKRESLPVGPVIGRVIIAALVAGTLTGIIGLFGYARAASWMVDDPRIAALVGRAVPWFALGSPLRFAASTAVFVLIAVGEGVPVTRWRLAEIAAKAGANSLLIFQFGLGFAGSFAAGALVHAAALTVYAVLLRPHLSGAAVWPTREWASAFAPKVAWETQRVLAMAGFALAGVALFSTSWFWPADPKRLDAYAAGMVMTLFVFAPLVALVRFLAFRLAGRPADEIIALVQSLRRYGVAVGTGAGVLLFLSAASIGRAVYGQSGPWWSLLVAALALSLPLRIAANVTRGALQSRNEFATVAFIDTVTSWGLGFPLIGLGLFLNSPIVAYAYLVVPELLCLAWLHRRLRASLRRPPVPAAASTRTGDPEKTQEPVSADRQPRAA